MLMPCSCEGLRTLKGADGCMLSYRRRRPTQAVVAATIASLGVAMSDVVVDSLVVERAPLTQAEA